MDTILLCSNHIPLVTSIHNTFIEKYMMGANGSYVKVYLYLSKCIQAGEEDLSISSLADQMENTEKDVLRALNYWEKKGLLSITRSDDKSVILGIDVLNPDELPDSLPQKNKRPAATASLSAAPDPISEETEEEAAEIEKPKELQHSFQVSLAQTRKLSKNQDFRWTCDVVESFLGRPLQPNEVQMISYMYDDLQFSSELIVHLYEYCTSLGKTHTNYIQKVAIEWHKKGVQTPEDAQNASAAYNAAYSAVSKSFALGRALAAVERKYVDRWQKEWLMDLSVICEACDRTMLKLQHADFKYTEGILEKWHRTGIHTLRGVQEADEQHARKKTTKKPVPATVHPIRKNSQTQIVEHGLTKEAADELEKKLLNKM